MALSGCRQPRRRSGAVAGLLLAAASACAYWGTGGWQQPPLALTAVSAHAGSTETWSRADAGGVALAVAAICSYLAHREPLEKAQEKPLPLDKRPDFNSVCFWSGLLSLISGWVNVVAILVMGGTVSHHTGNASHTGRLLGIDAGRFAALMAAFTVGAGVTGFSKSDGDAIVNGRCSPALMSSALAVGAAALMQWTMDAPLITLPLLAFSQGLQNGVTSRFSSLPLRTTHHTGTLTDLGIGWGAWLRAYVDGEPLPSVRKPVLMGVLVLNFAAGGYAAKLATDAWGVLAALVPAAVLAVIAVERSFGSGIAKA